MQRSLRSAKVELGDEDYVYVSIAGDPFLNNQQLASYADSQDFDWVFTIGTEDLLGELVTQYGRQILVTPTMAHFVIRPDGSVSEMMQGAPSPNELIDEIRNAST